MNDVSWRIEQLLTRWRIHNAQWRVFAKAAFLVWLISAVGYLFICLSFYDQRMVSVWVRASVISAWLPDETVTWRGKHYSAVEMADYLNQEYNGTPGLWLKWAGVIGLISVGVVGFIGRRYVNRPESQEEHVRGTELLKVDELRNRLRKVGKAGITVATVPIPETLHRNHFLVCGATGSGKTVTQRLMLRQIVQREEPCIVVDPEGEAVREFYSPERGDWLLSPLDARCPQWDPWVECESGADIEALAASLFPITVETQGPDLYYSGQARLVFQAIIEKCTQHDPRLIPELLRDPGSLLDVIAGTDGASALGARDTEKRQGILQKLIAACACFRHLSPSERKWSAREWAKERQGWVVLTFRETEREAVLPIVSLWLDSISRRLLDDELNPKDTTWIMIDELAVLRAQPNLQQILERGRKRGVAVVLGFQNVMQLYAIYGKETATTLLDQPKTRLLLGTNSAETQRWCSGDVGRREVERQSESETVGPENVRDTIGRSRPRREEPAVMGSEFGAMPDLHGILKVRPHGVACVQIPYAAMVDNQPAFIGRETVQEIAAPEKQEVSRKKRLL